MKTPEQQYLNTLRELVNKAGDLKHENRTGVGTHRTLGVMHKYDFEHGFPLFTTKRVWLKGIVGELIWFLKGSTNIKFLVDNGINIWNDDAYRRYKQNADRFHGSMGTGIEPLSKEQFVKFVRGNNNSFVGDLGPVYGSQWRNWGYEPEEAGTMAEAFTGRSGIDQIVNLIDSLKNSPSSRRHILSSWNVAEIDYMALPSCHVMSQYTIDDDKLWCHMYQRSCDMFLGVPFNVASYSLLTYILAHLVGVKPGGFIHTMHDCHIYHPHVAACKTQLSREPRKLPSLSLNSNLTLQHIEDCVNVEEFVRDFIELKDYDPHPAIKAELFT